MLKSRHLPNADRLSTIAAAILLAYALARMVSLPAREFSVQLPGLFLSFQVNIRTFVALIVAGLTAAGADWLLSEHPSIKNGSTLQHWLLPALTAWVIGLPLFELPLGPLWWAGFALGGGLLMLVLLAEYISVDPSDDRQPAAAAGLIAVSFSLYLGLAIALRFESLRLFMVLPALTLGAWVVSLRALHLRLAGTWALIESGVIALITGQLVAALYYWPLSPVGFGLAVLGPAYALTSLVTGLARDVPLRRAMLEPLIVWVITWGAVLWIR